MTLSPDLFRAILALDSYNRGGPSWQAGISLAGSSIGNASLKTDVLLPTGSSTASFFAQAYTWNGTTVISFRGTDKAFPSWQNGTLGDFANGWV
jgi:hypothetical protein